MLKQLIALVSMSIVSSTVVCAQENQSATSTAFIKPFTAEYTILHKSDPVGKGIRKLTTNEQGQTVYSYETNIEWLIFSDHREESSVVQINNGHVTPQIYHYERTGTGRDKEYKWQFAIDNNQATDLLKKRVVDVDFPSNIQDKLSYHLQHRMNMMKNPEQRHFVYPVIGTSGKIKNLVYEYDGEEEVMLPYGLVKAIKLKREVVEKKRITYAWFAPELDYLMVKLYQVKSGAEQFEAQLNKITTH